MSLALAATIVAYVVIAVLLLSLNIASSWKWWIKAGAIVVTTAFYAGSYAGIVSLIGWPSQSRLPEHFQFHASRIVEPDKLTGDRGAIYLWVERLDENNVPEGRPRAFELPYSDELADQVGGAQKKRDEGIDVSGTVEYGEAVDEETLARIGKIDETAESNSRMDTVPFLEQSMRMSFQDLPPVALPPKPPL